MAQIKVLKLVSGAFQQHDSAADDITFNTINAATINANAIVAPSLSLTATTGTDAITIVQGAHLHLGGPQPVYADGTYSLRTSGGIYAGTASWFASSVRFSSGIDLTSGGITTNTGTNSAIGVRANRIAGYNAGAGCIELGNNVMLTDTAQPFLVFWIGGYQPFHITCAGDLKFPSLDRPNAGTLTLGGTNATAITVGKSDSTVTVAGNLVVNGTLSGKSNAVAVDGYVADTGGVAAGHALRISADSTVIGANASTLATCQVAGFADAGAAVGLAVFVRTQGNITPVKEAAQVWTPGEPLYLSAVNDGTVTNVQPSTVGQVVLRVGFAKSNTEMLLSIGMPTVVS